jgi:hypothetical protein
MGVIFGQTAKRLDEGFAVEVEQVLEELSLGCVGNHGLSLLSVVWWTVRRVPTSVNSMPLRVDDWWAG